MKIYWEVFFIALGLAIPIYSIALQVYTEYFTDYTFFYDAELDMTFYMKKEDLKKIVEGR